MKRPYRTEPVIPKHEGWRYGELIYRAMYAHQGGKWETVSDRDKDNVWYPAGYRFAELLAERNSPIKQERGAA